MIEKLVLKFIKNNNIDFPNLLHPSVIGDFKNIKFGKGNIICARNIFTTDIIVDSFNVFNLNSTIGHNALFGDYNVINPSVNISGGVVIENKILSGTGAQVLQYKRIVSKTIVGVGAVVTKDIEQCGVYVGVPATNNN